MTLIILIHYKEASSNPSMVDILEEYVNTMKTLLDDGTLKLLNSNPIKNYPFSQPTAHKIHRLTNPAKIPSSINNSEPSINKAQHHTPGKD
eukprot:CAMPEP_0178919668 /NCGR_PEP_ID=MMETSP0786-20121207/14570_1 /TAXON_ID=186022 /ORGANISM="Thalassionema frauenfeldii, Strain CCMP 1798" /LENGTH=90 /DNA_ID=CAMNT_0020593635 /DNA_START=1474 /DNA_END=1743 /DNA_ORIENTATION=+